MLQQKDLCDLHTTFHAKVEKKSVLKMKNILWKHNLSFIKDVPMIYINLIVTVIIISEEKIGGLPTY